MHIYTKPGEYNVKLIVNNTCEKTETITIKEKKFVLDPKKIPRLIVPDSITVGQELKVIDSTNGAYSWEWRFGETSKANSTKKRATYSYIKSGLHTISLIVNGDIKHIAKKKIRVYDKQNVNTGVQAQITEPERPIDWGIPVKPDLEEVEELDEVVKAPYISEPALEGRILKIAENKISEKEFSAYLCGDINKAITVNGENTTFLVFCQKIRGKRIKIKRLVIFRNDDTNCITNLNIEYNRKFF
jgi:hypothetical protein